MASFQAGDRVEIAPHFDQWMRGDRYGTVVKHSQRFGVYVKMDKSGRTLRFAPRDLTRVNPRRKVSRRARQFIGRTIRRLAHKGERAPQRVAIAFAKARRKGYRVPKARRNPYAGRSETQAWNMVETIGLALDKYLPRLSVRDQQPVANLIDTLLTVSGSMREQIKRGVHVNPRSNPALAIVGGNPPLGKVIEIRYHRDVGSHPGYYRHRFKRGHEPKLVALSDGSLKVG